jgi:hypothetical protein
MDIHYFMQMHHFMHHCNGLDIMVNKNSSDMNTTRLGRSHVKDQSITIGLVRPVCSGATRHFTPLCPVMEIDVMGESVWKTTAGTREHPAYPSNKGGPFHIELVCAGYL